MKTSSLYVLFGLRLVILGVFGLLSSRFVLNSIGEELYGLYYLIFGFLSFIALLKISLESTYTRFFIKQLTINKNGVYVLKFLKVTFGASLLYLFISNVFIEQITSYVDIGQIDAAIVVIGSRIISLQIFVSFFASLMSAYALAQEKIILLTVLPLTDIFAKFSVLFLHKVDFISIVVIITSVYSLLILALFATLASTDKEFILRDSQNTYKEIFSFFKFQIVGSASNMAKDQSFNWSVNGNQGLAGNSAKQLSSTLVSLFLGPLMGLIGFMKSRIIRLHSTEKIGELILFQQFVIKLTMLSAVILVFFSQLLISEILSLWIGYVPEKFELFFGSIFLIELLKIMALPFEYIIHSKGDLRIPTIFAVVTNSTAILGLICFATGINIILSLIVLSNMVLFIYKSWYVYTILGANVFNMEAGIYVIFSLVLIYFEEVLMTEVKIGLLVIYLFFLLLELHKFRRILV